jgi:hypothetical protein
LNNSNSTWFIDVSGITSNICNGKTGITTLTIGNNVTGFANNSFSGCSGLTSITIPSSVTSIQSNVFSNCTGLTNITLPSSITTFGTFIFTGCTSLTNITINTRHISSGVFSNFPNNPNSQWIFDYSGAIPENICTNRSQITSLTIANGITAISQGAFSGCTGLTSINIPHSVTSISQGAFGGCTGFTSVNIPNSVTTIGFSAFGGTNISTVTIPSSIVSTGFNVFQNCNFLTTINIEANPDNITTMFSGCPDNANATWNFNFDGSLNNICSNRTGITNVSFNGNITSFTSNTFAGCSGLTSVTIPSTVTNIGSGSFYGCTGLTSISIPSSVISLGEGAFTDCTSLTSITIPSSITTFEGYIFTRCTSLTDIIINSSSINNGVFYDMPNNPESSWTFDYDGAIPYAICSDRTGITNISLIGITELGDNAFSNCTGLTSIIIPTSVTSIRDSTFSGCTGLTSFEIPSSVTNLGSNAFANCTGLTSIEIPDSVTSLGSDMFNNCTSLTNIIIKSSYISSGVFNQYPDNANTSFTFDYSGVIPVGIFSNRSGITNISFIGNITEFEDYAFNGCSGLTSIIIPASLTSIGISALGGCSGLTSITIPPSVTTIKDYAFGGINISSITISSTITSAGFNIFQDCNLLTNIVIETNPDTLATMIGSIPNNANATWVFNFNGPLNDICANRSGITDVSLNGNITELGVNAFSNCTGLTSITIPSTVTNISSTTFYGCTGLTSVIIPPSVQSLGDAVFWNCANLTTVFLPSSVTSLGVDMFNNSPGKFIVNISFNIPNQVLSNQTYTITNPQNPVNNYQTWSYTSSDTSVATISGNQITFIKEGIVNIKARLSSDNYYYEINKYSLFEITNSVSPSSFNYSDSSIINNYLLQSELQNGIITINSNLLTQPNLLNLNPTNGTNKQKKINRNNLVLNMFVANPNAQKIIVPINTLYLSQSINTNLSTYISLINTLESNVNNPVIIETNNISNSDVIFCPLENENNAVVFNGANTFSDYSVSIKKNINDSFEVIKKQLNNNDEIVTVLDGEVINYAGLTIVIGSVTVQLESATNIIPTIPVCFPSGTPVLTDQGIITIEKINKNTNTINNKKIVAITKTITNEKSIICIEKDAISINIPSQKTFISRNHKLLYNNKMIKAKKLVGLVDGVYNIEYNGTILYNVLLEKIHTMQVNNLIVETLDPENVVAKLYDGTLSQEIIQNITISLNNYAKEYKKQIKNIL